MERSAQPHLAAIARPLTLVEGLASFWSDLRAAPTTALLLDYDGTLAPFAIDRLAAQPLEGVVPALEEIIGNTDTFVTIVSGRPVSEVRALLGGLHVAVVGSHGWEHALPGADPVARALQPARVALLDAAEALASDAAGRERIERKHASIAVHLRGIDALVAALLEHAVRAAWRDIAGEGGLLIRGFNGGVELRALGWDKGVAVEEVLEAACPAFTAYLGDDDTDEDAFRVIGRWGVGIRVGEPADTLATGRLELALTPAFLQDWAYIRQNRDAAE